MRKINTIPICFLTCILFLVSCSKEKVVPELQELRPDKTSVDFLVEATKDSIVVRSTQPWKISKPANSEWLRLSTDAGNAGSTTVYLLTDTNVTNMSRTTMLTINSLGDHPLSSVQVTVNQSYDVKIKPTSNFGAPGGVVFSFEGSGFSTIAAENIVTINGVNAVVQSATNTMLSVTIPLQVGSGPVTVSVGNKTAKSSMDFDYRWVGVVTVVAGSTEGFADGVGTSAKFNQPEGLSFDAANNLYVADYGNLKVRKLTPTGVVTTLPGRIPSSSNPSGPNTDFAFPRSVAADGSGNIYIIEDNKLINGNSISKISSSGAVTLFAGGAVGYQDGIGTAAKFEHPANLVTDASGNIFVTDKDNWCIRKITPAGVVSTFAGFKGTGGYSYADGIGSNAHFSSPIGIDIDKSGNLFVADFSNSNVRKISPAGVVTTIAGYGWQGPYGREALKEAKFKLLTSIAVAPNGIVYVDAGDGSGDIRKINPNGQVETIGLYIDGSNGLPLGFWNSNALAVDNNGTLFASDFKHHICKITYR